MIVIGFTVVVVEMVIEVGNCKLKVMEIENFLICGMLKLCPLSKCAVVLHVFIHVAQQHIVYFMVVIAFISGGGSALLSHKPV